MKKFLLSFLLFICFLIPIGWTRVAENIVINNKIITPDLQQVLSGKKQDEYVRIIIRLQDQFSAQNRMNVLAKKDDKAGRRRVLVTTLREYAKKSQAPVITQLKRYASTKAITKLRSLWISNVLTMEARKSVIPELAQIKGIKYIKQDIKRPVFLQTPSWNIAHINADDVWSSGINGNGVLVAVIDSGIDIDHPDLVHRLWVNPGEDINGDGQFTAADNNHIDDDSNGYVDDLLGWDFGNNDNTVDSWWDHGVHVSGTIAGDGAGGTHTGVAPGARLMTLSYSMDIDAGQAEAWSAMEYALANGADIVNFSSGWKDSWSPDYETWRHNTDVLTDGGVLFVVAAGNDGPHVPAPGDILTPARAPRALAVGAVDNTDTIADFSSQGPTSWQGVTNYLDYIYPPGLLKPDICAPGVEVNSTVDGGGYESSFWSGTSMAAPHAAGTAALLLDKDPTLLPHELMFILRETAVDLGTTGPDNVYGYGRVDAQAAVDYNYLHTPVYDLSVTGSPAIWTSTDIWVDNNDDGIPDDPVANTNNHLYARIRNIGGQAVGNVEIKFYYADVATIGIAGFDPNHDGNPDDGNFNYIDSYFVPVIGPAGSSQDTAEAVVHWNVPTPTTDHWCVGIGIVAPNPPNVTEVNRSNNSAFRNFFNIILSAGQVYAFDFFVYPHPQKPFEPFELQFIRQNLPKGFKVDFVVEKPLANQWFKNMRGFEPIKYTPFKKMKIDEDAALKRGEKIYQFIRLTEEKGIFPKIDTPKGKPVRVRVIIQAPSKREIEALGLTKGDHLLVINAVDEKGPFGGLTLNVILKN